MLHLWLQSNGRSTQEMAGFGNTFQSSFRFLPNRSIPNWGSITTNRCTWSGMIFQALITALYQVPDSTRMCCDRKTILPSFPLIQHTPV